MSDHEPEFSSDEELLLDPREDLELIRRAVNAGLLPSEWIERAEHSSAAAKTLLEEFASSKPHFVARFAESRSVGESPVLSDDTSSAISSTENDAESNAPDSVALRGLPPRYSKLRSIGKGGMGRVFLAIDNELKRKVAIKVLKAERGGGAWTQMMRRESEVLAQLDHPGIVPIFDLGQLEDESPYIVMSFVEGVDLDEYVASKQLGRRERVSIVLKIAEAVGHAHFVKIVHRDLKPSNIRIAFNGEIIVLDFGIAKLVNDRSDSDAPGATDGFTNRRYETCGLGGAGTPAYMSPEQAAFESVDLRTDVYSLGVLLYELLGERLPWPAEVYADRSLLIDTISRQAPPRIRSPHHRVPSDLMAIVVRCLARDPKQRYANALELAAELRRFLDGYPVETYARTRPWYVLRKFAARNWVTVTVSLLAVLAAIVAAGFSYSARTSRLELALLEERRKGEVAASRQREQDAQFLRNLEAELRDSFQQRVSNTGATTNLRLGQLGVAGEALNETPPSRAHWETAHLGLRLGRGLSPATTWNAHDYEVLDGVTNADRRLFATTGLDGQVLVWDLESERLHSVLRTGEWCAQGRHWRHINPSSPCCPPQAQPRDHVLRLRWMADGRRLIGVSWRGQIVVWDTESRKESVLFHHARPLVALAVSKTGAVLVGDNVGGLFVGDIELKDSFKPIAQDGASVSALATLADDCWCVGRENGELTIIDAKNARRLRRETLQGPIWDLSTDDRASHLVIAPNESRVAILSLEPSPAGVLSNPLRWLPLPIGSQDHKTAPQVVAIEPGQDRMVVGDSSGHVTFWNLANQTPELQIGQTRSGPTRDLSKLPNAYQRTLSAVALSANGESLWTAGADTLVRRWNVGKTRFRRTITVNADPHTIFDRQCPELVWVASGRAISLLHSWTGELIAQYDSESPTAFNGITAASQSPRIATCAGGVIQFWRRIDHQNDKAGESAKLISVARDGVEIKHNVPLRSIALSSSGARVAAYDDLDRVTLWDVESGAQLAQRSTAVSSEGEGKMPSRALPAAGLLAFNSDGAQLLVCGPAQSPFILSSNTLEIVRQPGVASGSGPTAIAWHPSNPKVLVVGDSKGAIRFDPNSAGAATRSRESEVRGLTLTPDGRRLAVIFANAEIDVIDMSWKGTGNVYTFSSEHSHESNARITSLEFDPTGRRLLVTHADGMLEIWESQLGAIKPPPPQAPTRRWEKKVLDFNQGAADIRTRSQAITLDANDRIAILALALNSSPASDGASHGGYSHGRVILARESYSKLDVRIIDELLNLNDRKASPLQLSLALAREPQSSKFLAVYSRPTGKDDHNRQLMLYDSRNIAGQEIRAIGEVDNIGLETSLLFDSQGHVLIPQFNWDSYRALVSRVDNAKPSELFQLGRKGDVPAVTAVDSRGWLHMVGPTRRWVKDPGELWIYRALSNVNRDFTWDDPSRQINETMSRGASPRPNSLVLDKQDRPTLTYVSNSGQDPWSTAMRRLHFEWRESTGWKHEIALDHTVRVFGVSNHVVHPDDRVLIAYYRWLQNSFELHLATRENGHWQTEFVHSVPIESIQVREQCITNLALHLDSHNAPVIAAVQINQLGTQLLVLRPASKDSAH